MTNDSEGHVYFAHSPLEGLVKIGYSADPERRFQALQSGHDLPLELLGTIWFGGRRAEASYHDRFSQYREHGEWFSVEGDLREFLVRTLGCPNRLFGGNRILEIEDFGWTPKMEHDAWTILPVAARTEEVEAVEWYADAMDRGLADVLREKTPSGFLRMVRRVRDLHRDGEFAA